MANRVGKVLLHRATLAMKRSYWSMKTMTMIMIKHKQNSTNRAILRPSTPPSMPPRTTICFQSRRQLSLTPRTISLHPKKPLRNKRAQLLLPQNLPSIKRLLTKMTKAVTIHRQSQYLQAKPKESMIIRKMILRHTDTSRKKNPRRTPGMKPRELTRTMAMTLSKNNTRQAKNTRKGLTRTKALLLKRASTLKVITQSLKHTVNTTTKKRNTLSKKIPNIPFPPSLALCFSSSTRPVLLLVIPSLHFVISHVIH
ncbi:hypothetical protein FPQ18DRAFT_15104 [Pyronema domesticum]|nr:hypothetical protein FPQ18DRAFT_15104 [Pyronema domesticum]